MTASPVPNVKICILFIDPTHHQFYQNWKLQHQQENHGNNNHANGQAVVLIHYLSLHALHSIVAYTTMNASTMQANINMVNYGLSMPCHHYEDCLLHGHFAKFDDDPARQARHHTPIGSTRFLSSSIVPRAVFSVP
jgi:hypothetical protein